MFLPVCCLGANNCPSGRWPEIALPEYCEGMSPGDVIAPSAVINIYIDDDAPIEVTDFLPAMVCVRPMRCRQLPPVFISPNTMKLILA